MAKAEVRCPNCGTSFVIGKEGSPVAELTGGIHYLVPETIRHEHNCSDKTEDSLKALSDAGIDVSKLQTLMQTDPNIKDIFSDPNNKIVEEIGKGGFIKNPELFRRWITAQTFRLLKDRSGWTHAVRRMYDIKYVFNQSKRELCLLIKLQKKCPNDIRFQFFTLEDLKSIFADLTDFNKFYMYNTKNSDDKKIMKNRILASDSYEDLFEVVNRYYWRFNYDTSFKPRAWLNCFKGAGAYYTLQNIIRTHGLILPKCKDMSESLKVVDDIFKSIIAYKPRERRWDIMLSLLTKAVDVRKFELKY